MSQLYGTLLLIVGVSNSRSVSPCQGGSWRLPGGPSTWLCLHQLGFTPPSFPVPEQKRDFLIPCFCRITGDCGLALKLWHNFLFSNQGELNVPRIPDQRLFEGEQRGADGRWIA